MCPGAHSKNDLNFRFFAKKNCQAWYTENRNRRTKQARDFEVAEKQAIKKDVCQAWQAQVEYGLAKLGKPKSELRLPSRQTNLESSVAKLGKRISSKYFRKEIFQKKRQY